MRGLALPVCLAILSAASPAPRRPTTAARTASRCAWPPSPPMVTGWARELRALYAITSDRLPRTRCTASGRRNSRRRAVLARPCAPRSARRASPARSSRALSPTMTVTRAPAGADRVRRRCTCSIAAPAHRAPEFQERPASSVAGQSATSATTSRSRRQQGRGLRRAAEDQDVDLERRRHLCASRGAMGVSMVPATYGSSRSRSHRARSTACSSTPHRGAGFSGRRAPTS